MLSFSLQCQFKKHLCAYRRDVILHFLETNLYTDVLPTSVHTARFICGFLIAVLGKEERPIWISRKSTYIWFSRVLSNIDQNNKDYLSFLFFIWVWRREVFTIWAKSAYILMLSPTLIQTTRGRGKVIIIPNKSALEFLSCL